LPAPPGLYTLSNHKRLQVTEGGQYQALPELDANSKAVSTSAASKAAPKTSPEATQDRLQCSSRINRYQKSIAVAAQVSIDDSGKRRFVRLPDGECALKRGNKTLPIDSFEHRMGKLWLQLGSRGKIKAKIPGPASFQFDFPDNPEAFSMGFTIDARGRVQSNPRPHP
jgi:hypothetical protein